MKDSGIKWIGFIPDNWDVQTIRQSLIERIEKNKDLSEKNILSLSAKEGVTLYDGENHSGNKPREDLSDYKKVKIDDIVVNSMNILSGSVGLSKYNGVVSPVYYMYYKRNDKDNIKFFNYVFQCKEFQRSLRGLGNGILIRETENGSLNTIRTRIPSKKLGLVYIPYCEPEMQTKIVEFLENKTIEIGSLLELEEKQIDILKEYKKSVITEIITRGLEPNGKFKKSNVEWIDFIPESCKIVKIKNVCSEKISDGTHATPEYTSEELGFPFLSSKDIRNGYIDWSNIKYITMETHRAIQKEITPRKGDVLLSKNGSIGFSAIVETEKEFDLYVTLALLRPNKLILSKFLKYSIDSNLTQYQFNLHLIGIGVPNLHLNVIQDTQIILPPIDEQEKIIEYLDEKCDEIDRLIKIKQEKIEKLQEYKKSLIYEYVTGKKEV